MPLRAAATRWNQPSRGLLPETDADVSERSTSGSQGQARLQHARALLATQCVASCPVTFPPLTVQVPPSWSAHFCHCPGFFPLVMLQADESHCSRNSHRQSCAGPPGSVPFLWQLVRSGEVGQSHNFRKQTSDAPAGHSPEAHPRSHGHQAAQHKVHLPHPGSSSLSDRWRQRNASTPEVQ